MILTEFKNIKAVVLDVDGVLTDGSIQVTEDGEQLRTFHVRDGYAIQLAVKAGIHIWVITGGKSEGIKKRMQSLGVKEVFLGVMDKEHLIFQLSEKYEVSTSDMIYIGDDMPDLRPMQVVGIPICPSNAVEEIKAISKYVSPVKGGEGVVRDVLEKMLKLQDKWSLELGIKSI